MEEYLSSISDGYAYSSLDAPLEIRLFSFHESSRKGSLEDLLKWILCGKKTCNPVVGRLDPIRLDDSCHPSYIALSYTWESPFLPKLAPLVKTRSSLERRVVCGGKNVCAGENMYDVLAIMKGISLPHPIWIDALCIDQNNKDEASKQVRIMGDIYSTAREVIAWLGPHDSSSRIAIRVMKRIGSAFARLSQNLRPDGDFKFNDRALFSKMRTKSITEKEWQAVADFFSRTWFHRIWITQEIALSRKLRFLCGNSEISKDDIAGFAKWICDLRWDRELHLLRKDATSHPVSGINAFYDAARLIYRMKTGLDNPETVATLEHLFGASSEEQLSVSFIGLMLLQNQHKLASNLRDKVFAPLALAKMVIKDEDLPYGLPPVDYSKSIVCIYREMSAYIITNIGNLSFLSFVDRSSAGSSQLPSWTPDFSEAASNKVLSELSHNATQSWDQQGPSLVPVITENQLKVEGIFFDKVTEADHSYRDQKADLSPVLHLISNRTSSNRKSTDTIETLFRIMIQNVFERHWDPKSWDVPRHITVPYEDAVNSFKYWLQIRIAKHTERTLPLSRTSLTIPPVVLAACSSSSLFPDIATLEAFIWDFTILRQTNSPRMEQIIANEDLFLKMTAGFIDQRCIFRTRESHLGLGPSGAQMGDQVWFLQGARVPFVLRPLENGSFELVGEAYVHEFMQGEGFVNGELSVENAFGITLE
jgi:hypothetical protein